MDDEELTIAKHSDNLFRNDNLDTGTGLTIEKRKRK